MSVRPVRLNAMIAWLFIVGSACFVLGSVPAYLDAVGGTVDGVTYFVGSIFFTTASFCQLVQAQTPARRESTRTGRTVRRPCGSGAGCRTTAAGSPPRRSFPGRCSSTSARWRRSPTTPRVRSRTGTSGGPTCSARSSSSWRARSASSRCRAGSCVVERRSVPWWVAWVNMVGSVLFMASALAELSSCRAPASVDQHPAVRRRHAARCRVLPRRRRPDVPGLAPGRCIPSHDPTPRRTA